MERGFENRKQENAELREVEERLCRCNENFLQLSMMISHDLQQPLQAAANHLRTLETDLSITSQPRIGRIITDLRETIDRIWRMISDLLHYSRLSGDPGVRGAVNTEVVVDWVVSNVQKTVADSDAVITRDPLPLVYGDFSRLTHLFQNLIENAVKYRSEEAPPRVHISKQLENDSWVFSVKDNGIGIDPVHSQRIFNVFQRLHGPEYPGTGIGLSICKSIVELSGGRIWVESEPGNGATFRFTWPVSRNWPSATADSQYENEPL